MSKTSDMAKSYAGAGVIHENAITITQNYTLKSNTNGMSVGPVTINNGVQVIVPSGQKWVII
jgi:hypothetical protein